MQYIQSSLPQSGRNASVLPRPPHRGWQRRLKPDEPVHPEVPSQNITRTLQMSSQRKPLPTSPLAKHGIMPSISTMMPNSPEEGHSASPAEQKELDEFLRENLANRCIHLSKSPIRALVFFVKKKEGSLHLVQDYQKLNEITIKNSYPLLLVSDVLTRLHDAEWFTTLDLCWGFNNVHLKEGDKWKAAFSMNQGLFEPLVMFFGLCNSPATFQTMMNDILHPFIDRNEAICYMDDILIYSASLADHQRITQEILQTLRSYKLFLRLEKWKFDC